MTVYDRVSVTVGMILMGIILLLVFEIPSRAFEFEPLGTPLTFHMTDTWLASTLLLGLSCAGTEAIMRTHPLVRRGVVRYTFPYWILPGLATLALARFLPQSSNLLYWLIGLVAGGGILAWLILANYYMIDALAQDANQRMAGIARGGLDLITYLLALIFFTVIYRTRLRSLITATQVTIVASLLSLSILRNERRRIFQVFLYSGLIGLILGETTWALNYWRANALTVGVLLMLLFYVFVGLVQQYMRQRLNRRVVIEFLGVTILGIGIVIAFGPQV
jgi:hypothetical protein